MHSGSKKIEQVHLGIYMAVDEHLCAEWKDTWSRAVLTFNEWI